MESEVEGRANQGRRHGFESGGTILRAERAKKIFDPPLFGQWGDKILLLFRCTGRRRKIVDGVMRHTPG